MDERVRTWLLEVKRPDSWPDTVYMYFLVPKKVRKESYLPSSQGQSLLGGTPKTGLGESTQLQAASCTTVNVQLVIAFRNPGRCACEVRLRERRSF